MMKPSSAAAAAHQQQQHISSVPKAALETGGERVFVTHPRMFAFTHRGLASLRHPQLPMCLQQVEAEIARARKMWQTKGERLSDLLTDSTSQGGHEEERWKHVGRMLDAMLFENEIAMRRQHAMDNPQLRRALEMWWCTAGGTTSGGINESTYRFIHTQLYNHLLLPDSSLTAIIAKAVSQDWEWDSHAAATAATGGAVGGGGAASNSGGEIPFGQWYISLLEIADNWVPSCDGEAYGLFLESLLRKVFPPPTPVSSNSNKKNRKIEADAADESAADEDEDGGASSSAAAVASGDGLAWEEKVQFLRRNARSYLNPPLITTHRTMRHTIEYARCPPLRSPLSDEEEEEEKEEDEEVDGGSLSLDDAHHDEEEETAADP